MHHSMHLWPSVAKQPNLELKTRPKQLLGSLRLVIVLPGLALSILNYFKPHQKPVYIVLAMTLGALVMNPSNKTCKKHIVCM